METIDALADALNDFDGGMILVSHDFRLINQVAKEIWICEHQTVTKWKGTIGSYKEHLRAKIAKERAADMAKSEATLTAKNAAAVKSTPVKNGKK
jgi:ATP-binding cassette, subfamily F, member 2